MAVSWGVVRRAASSSSSSSSSITCSAGFSVLCSRFVPFSTRSSDDTPTQKSPFHDFGDRIENEIATYSNYVLPVPSGCPFAVVAPPGSRRISMERGYREELIIVSAPVTGNPVDEDGPTLPLMADLYKGKLKVTSHMTCKPDQLQIHRVIMSDWGTGIKDFTEYLGGIGITPKMISLMCDRLGCRQNKA